MREGCVSGEGTGKFTFAVVWAILLVIGVGFAGEPAFGSNGDSEKILSPDYLTVEKAQEYVTKLRLGSVEKISSTTKLLLQARGDDFVKAVAVLDLLDTKTEYVMGKLGASDRKLPSNSDIAAEMGSISIGTFSNPPSKDGQDRAIIDVHRDVIVVIIAAKRIDGMVNSISRLQKSGKSVSRVGAAAKAEAEPTAAKTQVAPKAAVEPKAEPKKTIKPRVKPTASKNAKSALEQAAAKLKDQEAAKAPVAVKPAVAKTVEQPKAVAAPVVKPVVEPEPKPVVEPKASSGPSADLQATIMKLMAEDKAAKAAEIEAAKAAAVETPVKAAVSEPEVLEAPVKVAAPKDIEPPKAVVAPDEVELPEAVAVPEMVEAGKTSEARADLQSTIAAILGKEQVEAVDEDATPVETAAEASKTGQTNKSELGDSTSQSVTVSMTDPGDADGGAGKKFAGYNTPELINGEDPLKVTLPETMTIEQLLALAGEYLQMDYMYEPADVKAQVTLKLQGKLRGKLQVKDLYPLMESVLKFKGLVMTRTGNVVSIVPIAKIADVDPALMVEGGNVRHGDIVITRIFTVDHIDTSSALALLTTMKLGVSISQIPENQKLIVTGYTYRMPRIEQLLAMIDKPGKPREFRYRQLKYTMAKALAPTISSLAEQLGTVSVSVSVSATTSSAQAPPGETAAARRARLAREAASRSAAAARGAPAAAAAAPDTVFLDADERTNRILMIGDVGQLEVVEQLIDTLDVSQADLRQMKTYKIENVDAEEVRKLLGELGVIGEVTGTSRYGSRNQSTSSNRTTGGTLPPRTPSAPAQPQPTASVSPTGNVLVEAPQVVVLEMTNSLLVNATTEQHEQLLKVIGYIDQMQDEDEIPYKIYPLENQKPEDLAAVLEQLIQETVKDKDGKVEQVVKRQDEEIVIVADEGTFSIIVYASKKNQEWISNLIEQLDKRRPQVLIDVSLVEISKTDEFSYDLDIINAMPDLTTGTSLIGSAILPPNASGGGRDRFIELSSQSGTGGTGFYADKHVNFLLDAIQTKNYGRILAKPKILVKDNEMGSIKTEDTTYVTKVSTTPLGTTGGAGNDFQAIQTGVTYDPYNAGVTLDITPHISEGELLTLEISLQRSDFLPTEDSEKPPNTTTSNLDTIVTVPNGSTIILGGMLKMNQSKGGSGIPILMDIPLLGGLFRGANNSDIQKKLYIFVRAEILRADEAVAARDMERISERNRKAFEEAELEFQDKQDWPGFKPKPVAPAKILELE